MRSNEWREKIDDAIFYEWPTVRDAHRRRFAVIQIRHAHHGIERKSAVRRRQLVHVVDFTVRRAPPVKWHAVPGSIPFFGVAFRCRIGRLLRSPWERRGNRRSNRRRAFGRLDGFRRRWSGLRRRRCVRRNAARGAAGEGKETNEVQQTEKAGTTLRGLCVGHKSARIMTAMAVSEILCRPARRCELQSTPPLQ